jgi:hypothetical protein
MSVNVLGRTTLQPVSEKNAGTGYPWNSATRAEYPEDSNVEAPHYYQSISCMHYPFVDVDGEKVDCVFDGTTDEIVLEHGSDGRDVGG